MTVAALKASFGPILVFFIMIGTWEGVCRVWHVPPYIMPSPFGIAAALWLDGGTLLHALVSTMLVTFCALGLSVVLGVLIAFVLVQSSVIERALMPYVIVMQVTPIVAIAPLIIILVHNTRAALILCATMIAIFPIISNTLQGLKSVDEGLAAYFRMHKASRLQTLLLLRLPSALPFFMAGLRISSGLALVGAVVAEFVAGTGGNSAGLAYEILQSGFQLNIPRMFAALFLITVAGIGLFGLMAIFERAATRRWSPSRP